jgi:putative ABC transport system permease protein
MDCRPRRVLHFLEEIDHSDSSPVRSARTTRLSGSSFKVASLDRLILASDCGRMAGNSEVIHSLVVRAAMNPLVLSGSIEQTIWEVNNNQAVANIETLEEIKSQSVAPARLRTALLVIFAGIALLLAAVGIYGVVSYSVAQRVHEMAIRLALGASPGGLLKLVIGKAMLMVLLGLALGGGAALALTRVLASLLYDTSPTDRVTWVAAGTLLAVVALLASYIPARRAMRVDPMVALRYE